MVILAAVTPLLQYLNRYLIKYDWLHASTLMWAWNFFRTCRLWGTTHLLSRSTPPLRTLTPVSLRLYIGNPSLSKFVSFWKVFGYFFVQRPSFIQGQLLLRSPHGPCIINSCTSTKPNGSSLGSGISADMYWSTKAAEGSGPQSACQTNIWAWGSPRFWNSIVLASAQDDHRSDTETISWCSQQ